MQLSFYLVRVLERLRALDEDAVGGADARAHHDGRRRGQPQRARAGDRQHSQRHPEPELPSHLGVAGRENEARLPDGKI